MTKRFKPNKWRAFWRFVRYTIWKYDWERAS